MSLTMIVTSIKTPVVSPSTQLLPFLDSNLPKIREQSIVVVTSKIISICQGKIVKNDGSVDKHEIIHNEAEYYIDPSGRSEYDVTLTIKEGMLIASSGIDESNGNGYFVLWPEHVHETTAQIWKHLRDKHHLTHLGILVTDTRATPLRWGTIGVALSWCGFQPLKNYIGQPDIFGKKLRMTKASIIDGLAAAADLVMGQGNEQTPLAVASDVPFVEFVDQPPTKKGINDLRIDVSDDLFSPLTNSPKWKKAERKIQYSS